MPFKGVATLLQFLQLPLDLRRSWSDEKYPNRFTALGLTICGIHQLLCYIKGFTFETTYRLLSVCFSTYPNLSIEMSASQLTSTCSNTWKVAIQKNHKDKKLPRMLVTIFSSTGPFSIRIRSSLERLSMGRIRSTESRMDHVVYQVSSTAIVHSSYYCNSQNSGCDISYLHIFRPLAKGCQVAEWLRGWLGCTNPSGHNFPEASPSPAKDSRKIQETYTTHISSLITSSPRLTQADEPKLKAWTWIQFLEESHVLRRLWKESLGKTRNEHTETKTVC